VKAGASFTALIVMLTVATLSELPSDTLK